jgi:hypothetical protein
LVDCLREQAPRLTRVVKRITRFTTSEHAKSGAAEIGLPLLAPLFVSRHSAGYSREEKN